ncbi:IQ domain-containing protein IQM6-like [Miscanthus floridulus]|uniref:IQ domain-containing protein IQM6-like n=1 Tax=Miscanthus floridulus TaxID=154761 RepID=UPI00345AFBC4
MSSASVGDAAILERAVVVGFMLPSPEWATRTAGRLVVHNGTLKVIWPLSRHYWTTEENFQEFKSFVKDNLAHPTNIKKIPEEEDKHMFTCSLHFQHC